MGDRLPSLAVGIEKTDENNASEFNRDSVNNFGSISRRVLAFRKKANSARAVGSGTALYYDSTLDVKSVVSEREIPAWIIELKSKKREVTMEEDEGSHASAVSRRGKKFPQRLIDEGSRVS